MNQAFLQTLAREYRHPQYVRFPEAPRNASLVPWLTSLYHNPAAGEFGNRNYRGNCSGNLIRDLLLYFQPKKVLDPMTGSGTAHDVCNALGISCESADLKTGFDAASPKAKIEEGKFDFAWLHPPYWRQVVYSNDERDLSAQPTLEAFYGQLSQVFANMHNALVPGGRMAVLMGDYRDREAGFCNLVWHAKRLALEAGFVQNCIDIIRFSHGQTSAKRRYGTSFIPGLHDVCMVFEKPAADAAAQVLQ